MEIGSKTAEKNSAQTNRQTDKPTDTAKIMVAVNQKSCVQLDLQQLSNCGRSVIQRLSTTLAMMIAALSLMRLLLLQPKMVYATVYS